MDYAVFQGFGLDLTEVFRPTIVKTYQAQIVLDTKKFSKRIKNKYLTSIYKNAIISIT